MYFKCKQNFMINVEECLHLCKNDIGVFKKNCKHNQNQRTYW